MVSGDSETPPHVCEWGLWKTGKFHFLFLWREMWVIAITCYLLFAIIFVFIDVNCTLVFVLRNINKSSLSANCFRIVAFSEGVELVVLSIFRASTLSGVSRIIYVNPFKTRRYFAKETKRISQYLFMRQIITASESNELPGSQITSETRKIDYFTRKLSRKNQGIKENSRILRLFVRTFAHLNSSCFC